ncbi:MAG: hypothetical protein KH117_05605 [Dysgonomonas sp.]|uniref:hypothetical protein n=1 Tax=Dysgonomonas sp. TaxID=1891233 RepID=UPI0025810219|nr:hypothetical protein [Dysgonomonas sp.]MBS7120459.1 hypothetical protein [Dysgonomonas sp.]
MNDLLKTELFSLLKNNSQIVTKQEMQQAYENFVEEVSNLNQSERDNQTLFRILNITRIEFKTLQAQILYEQGGKCPKESALSESNLVYQIGN